MLSRKVIITTVALVFCWLINHPAFAADAKIGIVNFQKIVETSEAGKAAKAEIGGEMQRMENDLKRKADEIGALQKQLESDSGVMSKEAHEEKKWDLDRKINDANSYQKKYRSQIQELEAKIMNQIRKDLFSVIQEIGQKEGYTLIIEHIGVAYNQPGSDITDQIVKLYNAQYSRQGKKK